MVLLGLKYGVIILGLLLFASLQAGAGPRTESICNLGMVKGEPGRSCQVPIPDGCTVAKFPGYDERWADVSKGGATSCQFNEAETDWNTVITGTCGPCKTDRCSGRFSVMFNCSGPTSSSESPFTSLPVRGFSLQIEHLGL